MTNCFHLAIPAGNIKTALKFYCDILGCKTGNQEEGRWIDINFWGNELTLHETKSKQFRERHDVDMGDVCVPHFGVHLEENDFEEVKRRIEASDIDYFDKLVDHYLDDEEILTERSDLEHLIYLSVMGWYGIPNGIGV